MRVGLFIYGSLSTISGGYLYDRRLVRELEAAGHEVEIISVPWRTYTHHLADNWSSTLIDKLTSTSIDLLLQDELNHPSLAWLNYRLWGRVHYPIITIVHHLRSSEHHPSFLRPLYRWVERRYLASVDGFLFNSNTTHATVMALAPTTKPQIVAYPAADHCNPPSTDVIQNQIAKRAKRTAPLRVLFVGNVIERKGLHHLLHALALVDRTQWSLRIIGNTNSEPHYTDEIMALITSLALDKQVMLEGSADDTTIALAYQESDLFAAPAYEGFGIVYLEAMSFGLPVIAATDGAAHELITDGENGYLVDQADHTRLAEIIAHIANQRQELLRLGQSARQRYDNHPTWHTSFLPVIDWLERQIENNGTTKTLQ